MGDGEQVGFNAGPQVVKWKNEAPDHMGFFFFLNIPE